MFDFASYQRAATVKDAVRLLGENPQARLIAGGTDVLIRLREGHRDYRHLVDIHDLPELNGVFLAEDGTIRIGSTTTFSQIIDSPIANEMIPVLARGADSVGGPQVRNAATIGGNVCNGAPSADSAAPLLVLEAKAELAGPRGRRLVPVESFYLGPGRVDCRHDEVMTGFLVAPEDYRGWLAGYIKYAMRDAMDIATIGCACACRLANGRLTALRLAYTVAGPTPLRCRKTEQVVCGMAADATMIAAVKDSVIYDLKPRDSWRSSKAFREHIIKVLAERILGKLLTGGERTHDS